MMKIKMVFPLIVIIMASGCGGGNSPGSIRAEDNIPPVITIIGNRVIAHEQGTIYEDQGATAVDNIDGNIAVSKSGDVGVDSAIYTIIYTAVDSSGNSSTQSRDVSVSDTKAPVITLMGQTEYTLDRGENYVEPGVNATDSVDGIIEVDTTGEVGVTAGTYVLTYLSLIHI